MKRSLLLTLALVLTLSSIAFAEFPKNDQINIAIEVDPFVELVVSEQNVTINHNPADPKSLTADVDITVLYNKGWKLNLQSQGFDRENTGISDYISYSYTTSSGHPTSLRPGESHNVFVVMNETTPSGGKMEIPFQIQFNWTGEKEPWELPWGGYQDTIVLTIEA